MLFNDTVIRCVRVGRRGAPDLCINRPRHRISLIESKLRGDAVR